MTIATSDFVKYVMITSCSFFCVCVGGGGGGGRRGLKQFLGIVLVISIFTAHFKVETQSILIKSCSRNMFTGIVALFLSQVFRQKCDTFVLATPKF